MRTIIPRRRLSPLLTIAALASSFVLLADALAQHLAPATPETIEAYLERTWRAPPEGWQARIDQDETQRICSETHNNPSAIQSKLILDQQRATIEFPVDGTVLGDWRRGEVVAQTGTGGQFSDPETTPHGGNCYACHQMAKSELSYGTLGPSLAQYGSIRKYSPAAAKAAYAKIYNAQSAVPCSNMPRFGMHKFLSEQQLKDVTAYLFDPQSPVNKP
jgi:L-cysteine S-thiosulfotransferase